MRRERTVSREALAAGVVWEDVIWDHLESVQNRCHAMFGAVSWHQGSVLLSPSPCQWKGALQFEINRRSALHSFSSGTGTTLPSLCFLR